MRLLLFICLKSVSSPSGGIYLYGIKTVYQLEVFTCWCITWVHLLVGALSGGIYLLVHYLRAFVCRAMKVSFVLKIHSLFIKETG